MSEFDAGDCARLGLLTDDLARLERRLRGLTPAAWRSRVEAVRAALVDLIAIEAGLRAQPAHTLPIIAEYALADALVVIGGDVVVALAAADRSDLVTRALSTVRATLEATR